MVTNVKAMELNTGLPMGRLYPSRQQRKNKNMTIPPKAYALASKWAQHFKDQKVMVSDWDLAKEGADNAIRNADVEYYILQAVLEMWCGEYVKGWNDCAFKAAKHGYTVISDKQEEIG